MFHKIAEFYKKLYLIGRKMGKRDRHGIHLKVENKILETLELIIEASFTFRNGKLPYLFSARIKIEIIKRLVRITWELGIINGDQYMDWELDLQEISKMTNGWIKYLQRESSG